MIVFCKSFHCLKLLKPLTFDKLFMIQLNSKSIAIFILFLGFFVVSCNQLNYTEINGFGGGIKTTKTKLEPKEVAQLKFYSDVKYDTSVLMDMATEPSLPNSENQFATESKSNIFGYEGDNDGMTIGFNMLMSGLIAALFGGIILFLLDLGGTNIGKDIDKSCLPALLVLFGLFFVVLGGLIFFISMLVAYS